MGQRISWSMKIMNKIPTQAEKYFLIYINGMSTRRDIFMLNCKGIAYIVDFIFTYMQLFLYFYLFFLFAYNYDIEYFCLTQIICIQLSDIKYFYLKQIIHMQLHGYKYSYLIQIIIYCLNFWDEAWWFLSFSVFELLSSSSLLYSQRFGRCVLRYSSGVSCRTGKSTRNFELCPLLNPRGSLALIPLTITKY